MENKVYDVVIIGSGPAALTAAIYTTRGVASTAIIGGENWGGQLMLTTVVDNYPGFPEGVEGPDLMQKMKAQAERFGALFVPKNATAVDFNSQPLKVTAGDEIYSGRAVIVATGAETRWLGVAGERELIGRGVSSCAPCDAPFFKDKKVVVVGGGDSAMEEALVLTKYASEVAIIHRRDEFRASRIMQEKVKKNSKINIMWDTEVQEFIGQGKLEKVKLFNNKNQKETEMTVDGAFVAIGHLPSTEIFRGKLQLDEKGYLLETQNSRLKTQSSTPGVFVAGDVHDHAYRQAITAAGYGCMAALDCLKYLDSSS